MLKTLLVHEAKDLSNFKQENVIKLGQIAVEAMGKDPKWSQSEFYMSAKELTSKEGLDVTQTALFTTAVAGFIEKRLRPELVMAGVIKVIDNFDSKGQNAIKVPLRSALITAADLPDSGQVSYSTGTYGSTTITLAYSYAANSLTHEIVKFANVDLIAEELGEIGDALSRKVDSDIVTAFAAATTAGNSNLVSLGSGTYVSYNNLVDAQSASKALYAKPDVCLMNPASLGRVMKLTQFAGGTSLVGSLMFKGNDTNNFPVPASVLNMRIVESLNCGTDDIYLIDTARTGYLVKAGGVETFDGRISGYLAYEVIGALNYGIGIVQPKALYRIAQNA